MEGGSVVTQRARALGSAARGAVCLRVRRRQTVAVGRSAPRAAECQTSPRPRVGGLCLAPSRLGGYLDRAPHGLRRELRHDDGADDGAAHLPNKRLQQPGAVVANGRVPQRSAALLRNIRLTTFCTAPAAEAQVR